METTVSPLLPGFVRLSGSQAEVENQLGPLAALVGTWRGNAGWNLIAVPSQKDGQPNFTLLIQNYSETITFTPIGAPVPNRGGQVEQFITGLMYDLTVVDNTTEGILHLENGMWLNLSNIQPQPDGPVQPLKQLPPPEFSIARQASIPHGDVVIALGNATTSTGKPNIPNIVATPPDLGHPKLLGYLDPYKHNAFPQFDAHNPNSMLQAAIKNQNIGNVTTITVDTANKGGSIVNIPFIDQHVNPTRFVSTFWIEQVITDNLNFMQLQYSQQADLNFLPKFNAPGIIMWPHVNVNTLRKQ